MSEWWTYRPSDFLLFAPRTYYRLFELYNVDIWPLQILALLAGAAILVLIRSRIASSGRVIAVLLAACWLWVAWAFHWQRYATINWAAGYFAVGFAIEALLLIWIGVVRHSLRFDSAPRVRARIGVAIFAFALTFQPLLQLLSGRSWQQLEVFGVAPDPTAVATLGVLLASNRMPWIAVPLPLIWCVIGGVTLWLINSPH
jgi:threonine/homoserine efflux transporter RhtA